MEWEKPVSMLRWEDDEIARKRAEYTAKHGYYVSFPRIRDIIHVKRHQEPTEAEFLNYKQKNVKFLGQKRYDEIDQIVKDKRRRYNTILASPVPAAVKNYVSTMTWLDDINDTLGTAGVVMRFLARLAPRALAKFFLGPAGWLFIAAAIIGLIMEIMRKFWLVPDLCIYAKRNFGKYGKMNPWSKKNRAKRARKLKRLWPSWGELIELLQVTDSMFGIGLCLGPIFGAAFDFVSGTVRSIRGEKVTFFRDPPPMRQYEKTASRVLRGAPIAAALNPILTTEEQVGMYWALYGSVQVMEPYWELWDPLDNIKTLDGLEVEAPRPRAPTTLHVLAEHNWNGRDGIGWPGTNERWSNHKVIAEQNKEPAAKGLKNFAERNRNNFGAMFGAQAAADFFKTLLAQIAGADGIDEQWEEHHEGWAKFMEDECKFTRCHGNFKHGQTRYQICTHQLGGQLVQVYCTEQPPSNPLHRVGDKGIVMPCEGCDLYLGMAFCTGSHQDHIFAVTARPFWPDHDPPYVGT